MFNSSVLDVAMGLMFVYLVLGLICTTINEWLAQLFDLRARTLKAGIQSLLRDLPANAKDALENDLAAKFYRHPLIRSLSKQGGNPSYIPARAFSLALTDILGGKGDVPGNSIDGLRGEINNLADGDVKKTLLLLMHGADQVPVFEGNLEKWFNDSMDRVSGWYKRQSQIITVAVAIVITIGANADSVNIARKLFVNPTLREKIVHQATSAKEQPAGTSSVLTPEEKADLSELTGWGEDFQTFNAMKAQSEGKTPEEVQSARRNDSFPGLNLASGLFFPWLWAIAPAHLFGWVLTLIAASLGAPFWFDTLNKFMNIRAAGTAPNEKGKDLSKA